VEEVTQPIAYSSFSFTPFKAKRGSRRQYRINSTSHKPRNRHIVRHREDYCPSLSSASAGAYFTVSYQLTNSAFCQLRLHTPQIHPSLIPRFYYQEIIPSTQSPNMPVPSWLQPRTIDEPILRINGVIATRPIGGGGQDVGHISTFVPGGRHLSSVVRSFRVTSPW
jgi:hypothetical protein